MATRKPASSAAGPRRSTARRTTSRSSARRATSSSTRRRRTSAGSLYPRRRARRPGLPTTVGTALGTLVVTTLLDLSWPVRLLLIGVVLVLGLAYVLWRHRAEITAGTTAEGTAEQSQPAAPPAPAGPGPDAPPTSGPGPDGATR